jgi:hypothetical protein
MFVIYYHLLAGLLFHFEDTLQMAILLTRMKIFNSFVRKNVTQKPQLIASSLFLTCLFIDSPVAFALKISSYHYYTDNKQENVNTFYIMTSSDFSSTPYGQLLLAFTSFFLNLLLTLVVGVILNIVSVCQYKLYLRGKKQRDEAYKRASNPGKSEQVLKRQEMTVKRGQRKKCRKEFAFYGFDPIVHFDSFAHSINALLCVLLCVA